MPFFANAKNVSVSHSTFQEFHGDYTVVNGSVLNVNSFNKTTTETTGSYNDSSVNAGRERHDRTTRPTADRDQSSQGGCQPNVETNTTPATSPSPQSPFGGYTPPVSEMAERMRANLGLQDAGITVDFKTPQERREANDDDW